MTARRGGARRPAPDGISYIIAVLRPLIKAFCVKEVCSPVIYVTGDRHGDSERFTEQAVKKMEKGDTISVLGTSAFPGSGGQAERKDSAWLE